jgi:hypothetical protein
MAPLVCLISGYLFLGPTLRTGNLLFGGSLDAMFLLTASGHWGMGASRFAGLSFCQPSSAQRLHRDAG